MLLLLSSYDEVFSGVTIGKLKPHWLTGTVFKTQKEWVESTIEWVTNRKDVHCVIRIHPRIMANKRDSMVADIYDDLLSSLKLLPDNVTVDWPEMRVSLYDHFRFVNTTVTGWSFSGLEALLMGIPTVSYDEKIVTFPASLHFSGQSTNDYFENLSTALEMERTHVRSLMTFKWLCNLYGVGTIKIGGRMEDRVRIFQLPILRRLLFELRKIGKFRYLVTQYEKRPRIRRGELIKLLQALES